MEIFDLSHTIEQEMPLYPGTEPIEIIQNATVAAQGYNEKKIVISSHIGTHIDAPAHMLDKGNRLNQMPVTSFYGSAQVIDVRNFKQGQIELDYLQKKNELIEKNDFVIFYSGYEQYWGQERYFKEYPVLSTAAAQWLSDQNLKGVGLDACSVDPVGSDDLPVHHTLFAAGLLIVENLTNLQQLPDGQFIFSCFPLKIDDADGSPVRAVAILN